jgi:hypothetical protein
MSSQLFVEPEMATLIEEIEVVLAQASDLIRDLRHHRCLPSRWPLDERDDSAKRNR